MNQDVMAKVRTLSKRDLPIETIARVLKLSKEQVELAIKQVSGECHRKTNGHRPNKPNGSEKRHLSPNKSTRRRKRAVRR